MREIVLDTETTGFEPAEGHRLVEIGCIELTNKVATGRTFHEYINPERDMPEGAFNVHGLSSEFLSDKPLFKDVADAFLAFIDGAPLVIHNAQFDMKFLNWELTAIGKPPLPPEQAIDTLDIARRKFPGAQNSLDALCRRFNIDNSNRVKHGALLDSELLAEVYLDLVGGRQPNLGLLGEEKAASGGLVRHTKRPQRPAPLGSLITAEEQEAHDEFVDGLGGTPLWRAATSQG